MRVINLELLFLCIGLFFSYINPNDISEINYSMVRSKWRKPNKKLPTIVTQWANEEQGKTYTISNSHLNVYPLFSFSQFNYDKYALPNGTINCKYDSSLQVTSEYLKQAIEHVIAEIYDNNKIFTYFTTLQDKNFNWKQKCGLIVLKLKHPSHFVIKLFIETPQTFISFYGKGIEPICFFYMSGGGNRHLSGLTRIPNLEEIKTQIDQSPFWCDLIDFPRKWIYIPRTSRWIKISGYNFPSVQPLMTLLPSIYVIIADAISKIPETPDVHKEKKELVMHLCNDLGLSIDPHENNYTLEKINLDDNSDRTNNKKFILSILDTEHFPTMVGLEKTERFYSHGSWYLFLAQKCFGNTYLHFKDETKPDYFRLW